MEVFIVDSGGSLDDIPDRMPGEFDLRSPISRDMADTTQTYIKIWFPKRVLSACRFAVLRCASLQQMGHAARARISRSLMSHLLFDSASQHFEKAEIQYCG